MVYIDFRNEVQTNEIIDYLLKQDKRPIIPISIPSTKSLLLSELKNPKVDLIEGTYGILEPKKDKIRPFDPNDLDLIFRWHDGKLVPDVDEAVIEQIDKMTEEILAEDRASNSLETTQKTEITTNEPATPADTESEAQQVDITETQREIPSESHPYLVVFVTIGLLIIIISVIA